MLPVAKMYDMAIGTCVGHKIPISTVGYIMSMCPTVLVNGMPIARQMDIVITSCGHIGYIAQGSSTVLAKSIPVAKMGDMVTGVFSGTIIQGSSNVLAK